MHRAGSGRGAGPAPGVGGRGRAGVSGGAGEWRGRPRGAGEGQGQGQGEGQGQVRGCSHRRVWCEHPVSRPGAVAARAGLADDGSGICCSIPSQMGVSALSWPLCPHAGAARQLGVPRGGCRTRPRRGTGPAAAGGAQGQCPGLGLGMLSPARSQPALIPSRQGSADAAAP